MTDKSTSSGATIAVWITVGLTLLGGGVTWYLRRDWPSAVSIAGSIASILGLAIVYVQVRHLTTLSAGIRQAVSDYRARMTSIQSVADTVHLSSLAEDVKRYVRTGEWEAARIRMKTAHELLIHVVSQPTLQPFVNLERCQRLKSDLGIQKTILDGIVGSPPASGFDIQALNGILTDMIDMIAELETRVKAFGGTDGAD